MNLSRLPHPLSDELVELISDRMGLLGHPTRIRILDQLREGEHNVQAIADAMATTQQNVSGHLRLLYAAGIVSRRSGGREVFYAIVDNTVFEHWEWLVAALRKQVG